MSMMHIPLKSYPWYVSFVFWLQRKHYGQVLNSAKVWAKSPRLFLALSLFYGTLDRKKSPLSIEIRSLIIVRVSQLNGCSFCVDLNTSVLLKRGVSLEKVQELSSWKDSEMFSDCEKASLRYAESLTTTKTIDPLIKEEINKYYTSDELIELTALIAFQNMSTLFNNAFDIEPQGFCVLSQN